MGLSAVLSGVLLMVSAGLLLTFFVTGSESADRAANWVFLAFYAVTGWTIVQVHNLFVDQTGWIWSLTVLGILGVSISFLATLVVALGRVDFTRVAVVSTAAFGGVLVWMLGVSILVVALGVLPRALGWYGVIALSLSALFVGGISTDRAIMTGERRPGPVVNGVSALILLALVGWFIWLGTS